MRTLGAGNSAQPTSGFGPDAITAVKVEVADAADALVDLTEFVVALEYEQTADEIVDAARVVFRRLSGASSLAPLMTASPPVAIGRRIIVSINPGSGTYKEVFRGQIDDVDWPERDGDVTVLCRDRAGIAADTWIEELVAYGSTAGVSLETVMQKVVDDNLTTTHTLNFPAATSAVVQHLTGDQPYTPGDQMTLDALRALADSIGWMIRWRHFDASADDWKWTVFEPSRSKTVPDHTFATTAYWNVTTMKQSIADIRNVVEVEYEGAGTARAKKVVEDATSIATYDRRYMKIAEPTGSPVNNATLATALANAALSDLKDPDALLEIECRYFWPGEVGVDLYRFTANDKHFSTDQDLAAMAFRHRIAVGERPTTWILCRGKPSGGVKMWKRRIGPRLPTVVAADMKITGFREISKTDTTVTLGWEVSGSVDEIWVYTSTPAQPLASDPWAGFTGTATVRLTGDSTSHALAIPDPGLITYGLLYPIGVRGATIQRGPAQQFTIQGELVRLIQLVKEQSTTATQTVVRAYVANPLAGGDITVAAVGVGATVSPASGTIVSASVTTSIDTTGYVEFTITRPAFQAGNGRVTFTATSTDRTADVDAVDVAAQERDTVSLFARAKLQTTTATQVVVRCYVADPVASGGSGDVSVAFAGTGVGTISPASPLTITSGLLTTDIDTTDFVEVTVDRAAFGTGVGRLVFTATRAGRASATDAIDIPSLDRDTVELLCRAEVQSTSATQVVVRVAVADPVSGGSGDVTLTYSTSGATVSPASPQTLASAGITADIETTATVDITVDRRANLSGPERCAFKATRTGRAAGIDAVDVPEQERDLSVDLITTTEITDLAISTPKLAAGAVIASKISVTSLDAVAAEVGSIVVTDGTSSITYKSGSTDLAKLEAYTVSAGPTPSWTDQGFNSTVYKAGAPGTTASMSWQYRTHSTQGDFGLLNVGGRLQIATHTPASASAAGDAGMIAWDASYIYVCTATDTWERVAIATW